MVFSFRFYLDNTLKRRYKGFAFERITWIRYFSVQGIKVFTDTYNAFIIYITFLFCYLHRIIRQSELFNVDQLVKLNSYGSNISARRSSMNGQISICNGNTYRYMTAHEWQIN